MIELAPHHKIGLPLNSPLMPATGFFGYDLNAYPNIINGQLFGALVTNPITLRPQHHPTTPQINETHGGFVVNTPPSNPGVKRIIKHHKKSWQRSPIPIIAHLPVDAPDDLSRTARTLARLEGIAAIETELFSDFSDLELKDCLHAILQHSELPLLLKLPLPPSFKLIETALSSGVDALVVASAPNGATYHPTQGVMHGTQYGAGVMPSILPHLVTLHAEFPEIPLIACGGVHSIADVTAYLQAGAKAVQIDSLIFTNPSQVQKILLSF